MAPGIQVPVVAVVHEPLRRDLAFGLEILLAVVVPDPQPQPLEERRGDDAEVRRHALAPLGQKDLYPFCDLLPEWSPLPRIARSRSTRRHLAVEQPGLEAVEELHRGEERLRLGGVEPQARQLVARARARSSEAVAFQLAVVLDGRIEAAAHVLEVAPDARAGHSEHLAEDRKRNDLALLQELVDLGRTARACPCARTRRRGRDLTAWRYSLLTGLFVSRRTSSRHSPSGGQMCAGASCGRVSRRR